MTWVSSFIKKKKKKRLRFTLLKLGENLHKVIFVGRLTVHSFLFCRRIS